MSRRLRTLCSCLCLLPGLLGAAPVQDQYRVSEPLTAPDGQQQALHSALDRLLVRLTGGTSVLAKPELADLRQHPEQVASRYEQQDGQLLIDFDGAALGRALEQAHVPVWGEQHSTILAWWVEHNPDEGNSLFSDNQPESAALHDGANSRGLSLVLPLGDLQEQMLSGQPEGDLAALNEAARRYGADALLTVSEGQAEDGHWQGNWRLAVGDKQESGQVEGPDRQSLVDGVLSAVAAKVAPLLAKPSAPPPSPTRTFEVQIDGVDLSRYAEVQRVLEPFQSQLLGVNGQQLAFRVTAREDDLRKSLESIALHQSGSAEALPDAGGPLPMDAPPVSENQPVRLYFSW